MSSQFLALASGLLSIFAFQCEQELRIWLDDFHKERPVYRGSWLPVAARMSEKLKSHEKTIRNIVPCIAVFRWAAVILSILSLFWSAAKM